MVVKKNPKMGILRIGTSGIALQGNKHSFPPEFQQKSRLSFYSTLFNTIEINSTFYKIPKASTCERWSQEVPPNFQFTIKLWKEITHITRLNFDVENLKCFFNAAKGLETKAGCILIQFPGKITLEYYYQVEFLLHKIREFDYGNNWRKSVEFRNPTWYVGETFELLSDLDASMVIHDIPKAKILSVNEATQFIYLRFHGPKGDYRGSYSEDFLYQQSLRINNWLNAGKNVYAYFNNTIGSAYENAISLKGMIAKGVNLNMS